jgi:tetratricopeptide (TPR) repeat protein
MTRSRDDWSGAALFAAALGHAQTGDWPAAARSAFEAERAFAGNVLDAANSGLLGAAALARLGRTTDALAHARRVGGRLAYNAHGVVCKALGELDRAERSYERALRIVAEAGRVPDGIRAALLHNVAGLAHAASDARRGLPHALAALALRAVARPADEVAVAIERAAVAPLLMDIGGDAAALVLLNQARATLCRQQPLDVYEVAVIDHNLGVLARRRGDLADAADRLGRAVAGKAASRGATHPDLAVTRSCLADVEAARDARAREA